MTPPPAPPPNTYRALLRLYPYVKPAMGRIYWGMAAALIAGIVALLIPQVLRALVDGPLQNGNRGELITPVILVVGLGILEAAMIWLRRWLVLQPGTHVEAAMRNGLYRKLQDLPVSFHDRWPSGQLLSRAVSDLNQIRRWLSFGIVLLVVNALTIAIGLIFLISINWILGGLFLLCSIPLWIYGYLFENKYSSVARLSQDQTGDLATSVEESVHGIRVLKAFGRGRDALATFGTQAEGLRATEIEKAKAVAGIWLWLLLIPDVTFALGLLGGVWLAANGELTVGELAAFFATASVLRFPVESIGFLLSMTLDTKNAVDRFFEVMDTDNTITDPAHPLSHPTSAGELTFDSVHYRYPDAPPTDPDLLNGVTLTVHSGETLALVGITGSGKSTLTALTTRLYDVTGGSIRLDGHDIRDLTRTELRTHIAMAFEDAILFSASVRDNIAMGRPDATDADIDEAIQIAQAAFVYDLPAGLDTLIGEEGMSLSGGQRQRLALARAVAARPAILMLDDPLSALDVDTEALVEAALRSVLTTTTAVIVAHRPSTVMLADRVALLDGGIIAAIGTHTHLLATNERYRHVISSLEDELTREQAARA